MQRVTISMDEPLAGAFDDFLGARGYASRSEGVRDLIRQAVRAWRRERGDGGDWCVANLSYVYDRSVRDMADRLSQAQHENHDLIAASMQVRLDHDNSLETLALKGPTGKVRAFADRIRAEKGVSFGALNLVAVARSDRHLSKDAHEHAGGEHLHPATP